MANLFNCDSGTFEVRILQHDEKVESFNCGDDDLNDFLLNRAIPYRKALLAVKYVFENIESVIKTGCRFIIVDAYYNAIPFYQNNDFQYLKREEEDIITRLLYYDLNDIA